MVAFVTAELSPRAHLSLSAALVALALLASGRASLRLVVILLSVCASARYIWYRATETLAWELSLDGLTAVLLFSAEFYAFVVLLCGYFQTAITRRRVPVPFDASRPDLPLVDVYVPSYNEDLDLLHDTLAAAKAMDYPRMEVYLLDDGRRPEARALAESLGCRYLTRDHNKGAKAGNVNAALPRTHGELIAMFDADHAPVRTFLSETVGFFLVDPKVALVQTPHYFYNPDQFERNLHLTGVVPPEQKLFYHAIQAGNDFWNGAFFCGSCAVIRRTAMEGVGGMAEETLTEDAHTALKMHAAGWRSVYLDVPLAAGIATERLAFFVSQRVRWARGMAQVFRLDNPLLKRGLSLPQRFTYFAASWHFLFGIPRLLFVLAPAAYLVFGVHPMFADVREVAAFAAPHLLLAWIGTAVANRQYRHSFWPEVFETVLAFYTAVITTAALVSPHAGVFKVTTKGATSDGRSFDWRRAAPTLGLLALVLAGVVATGVRLNASPLDRWTVLVAGAWNLYNLLILAAAAAAAWEQPQRRVRHRVPRCDGVEIVPRGDTSTPERALGTTLDVSVHGARVVLKEGTVSSGRFWLRFTGAEGRTPWIRAEEVGQSRGKGGEILRVRFVEPTPQQRAALAARVFSAPDAWLGEGYAHDNPLRSALAVLLVPVAALFGRPELVRRAVGEARPTAAIVGGTSDSSSTPFSLRVGAAVLAVLAFGIAVLPPGDLSLFGGWASLDRWEGASYATRYARLHQALVDLSRLRAELAAAVDAGQEPPSSWDEDLGRVRRAYQLGNLDLSQPAARAAEAEQNHRSPRAGSITTRS